MVVDFRAYVSGTKVLFFCFSAKPIPEGLNPERLALP